MVVARFPPLILFSLLLRCPRGGAHHRSLGCLSVNWEGTSESLKFESGIPEGFKRVAARPVALRWACGPRLRKTRFVERDQSDSSRPVPTQKIFRFVLHANQSHIHRRPVPQRAYPRAQSSVILFAISVSYLNCPDTQCPQSVLNRI